MDTDDRTDTRSGDRPTTEEAPAPAGDDQPAGGSRARARTRTRSRRAAGATSQPTGAAGPDHDAGGGPGPSAADEPSSDRGQTPSDGDETSSDGAATSSSVDAPTRSGSSKRRRSRRGRRGRGRRKRGAAADAEASTSTTDEAAAVTEPAAKEAPKPSRRDGPGRGGEGSGTVRGSTRIAARQKRGDGRRQLRHQRPTGVPEEVRRAILEGPPRTMLVTAGEDRTQLAVLEDRRVVEHYVTRKEDVTFVGNIYKARVQNVLPGMEAAFLDIGKGRNGVLYAGEVLYDELDLEEDDSPRIEDALKPGQSVLVQVTKDPMGSKGPRLTMHLSLAGRYMVLAPNSELFGISRKLTDRERDRLRGIVKKVRPEGHGLIVRTAAENATEEQLTADVERLLAKWQRVAARVEDAKTLEAVYEEPPLVVKVIRDNFGPDFERCIVDSKPLFDQVVAYLDEVAPELVDKVELYGAAKLEAEGTDVGDREFAALFDAYNVTEQLRKAMGRKVWLPSGGYLIVESTEAMKVIDVNTGKYTGKEGQNLEEVVLRTNLEAAEEIVRQLRLRDMGGIIVIDFIDMLLKANQDQVVRKLKRELLRDRTKTRVSEVSRLGLVQMTRKNVSQGLVEAFSRRCEHCEGLGYTIELDA